jgi:isocitrate dehydrogenase
VSESAPIRLENDRLFVPDRPIVGFIEGDGTGPDITAATLPVLDEAVRIAYGGRRSIAWQEILAGEKAFASSGEWLPKSSVDELRKTRVSIKGPLTTPVGGGIRSLNVAIRQMLDLYACIRPVRHYPGLPSPVRRPEQMDVVIFRENTEDVYAGYEWKADSPEAAKLRAFLAECFGIHLGDDTGVGIKPISRRATHRLVRMAIQWALAHERKSVTLVHKGNIMKYTEGAFRDWGYELAVTEFRDRVVTEEELWKEHGGKTPAGKLLINDRIADNMFQQILTRTADYDVLATPNLNGDYLSDACAAQVGGLGIAPGGNVGDNLAVFEATHGTAPKYAGLNKVNPSSLILSGAMMLEYLGWPEAAALVEKGIAGAIADKKVTYDLARLMEPAAPELGTRAFAAAVMERMR